MSKILVIEDEELLRSSLMELLEIEEYEVIGARDGVDGLQQAVEQSPDLIICDIMMPRMNGYEVIKNLRENPTTETIPFIFLTAKADKLDSRFGMDLGADDYLTKPFSKFELYNSVKSRLEKRKVVSNQYEQKLNNLKNNLASTLPHELRTPLNGILASSQFLIQEIGDMQIDEVKEILQTIYISGIRLSNLVTNYLIYSELELISNDIEACNKLRNQKIFSVKELIDLAFSKRFEEDNRMRDIYIEIEDAQVNFSDMYLKKLCEELADNAFKFSKKYQLVLVKVWVEQDQLIIRVINDNNLNTKISPSDIGAYVQFNRDLYEQQGSGMGLAIVKKLISIYNGKLEINNTADKKIEFIITIPNAFKMDITQI